MPFPSFNPFKASETPVGVPPAADPNAAAQNTQPPAHANNPANQPDAHKASDPNHPEHGTNPGSANNLPANQPAPQTPLDTYDLMFHNKPTEGDKPVDVTLAIPDETMDKIMENVDFSKDIDPALMAKFQAGDVAAAMDIMKVMTSSVYRQSMQHSAAVTNSNLNLRGEQLGGQIKTAVQDNLSTDAVNNSDIPNIEHPAVKREVQRVAAQFREANKDATAAQISQATKNYFRELQAAMTPEAQPSLADQNKAASDWSDVDSWLED